MAIVIANMIGTGAFTSLGFQVKDLSNNMAILTLWVVGGIIALAGAFSYAEVGTVVKKSGGEYAFLSKIYHPVIGYLAGWISITAGFSAPIALSAIAAIEYFPHGNIHTRYMGIALVAILTLIHTKGTQISAVFQNTATTLKVLVIILFIILGIGIGKDAGNSFLLDTSYVKEVSSSVFAVALIYVGYSYSGWNAAAYLTDDFKNSRKSLPISLIGGTMAVMILYVLLQYVFLKNVPVRELEGKINIGVIAISKILDPRKAKFFGIIISMLLVSGISAMVWVGARVTSCIAEDYTLWKYFRSSKDNIPKKALWLQFALTSILIITETFEQIMIYCGFLLTLCTMLVVAGVFVSRRRSKEFANESSYFRSPLFPITQIFYLLLSLWIIFYSVRNHPYESMLGILNLLIGLITYLVSSKYKKRKGLDKQT